MAWIRTQKRKNPKTGRTANYYSVNWRDREGRTRQRALGFISLPEANKALTEFERRLAAGELLDVVDPAPSPPDSSGARRLGEFLETTYLPRVKRDRSAKTLDIRRSAAAALTKRLGDRPLSEITFRVIDDYVTERAEGVRSRTVQLDVICLRQALKLAVERGELDALPRFPVVPLNDAKPHRFLTEDESKRILQEMDPSRPQTHVVTRGMPPDKRDKWSWLAVYMALNTGMRRGEILSREWADVKWDRGKNGILLVADKPAVGFKTKTRRSRAIPLTRALRAILVDARTWSPSRWIFPSERDPNVPRQEFRHALENACDRAGIPRVHAHALRHSWASRLAQSGVDRRTLMEMGGWKTSQMLDEVYSHVTDDHMDEVMDRMGLSHLDDDEDDED